MNSPIKTVKRRSTCLRKQGRKKKRKVSFLTKQVVVRDQPFDFRRGGGGGLGFFLKIFFLFSSIFIHSLRAKIFFSGQSKKQNIFSKQHICSKCFLLDLYVRVFLEPNIHGYIVYMFVYILDIGSECICTY